MIKKTNICESSIFNVIILIIISLTINFLLIVNNHTNIIYKNNMYDTITDTIYFTTTTLSTIGYGDKYPITNLGKLIVSCQHIFVLLLALGIIAISC